MGYHPLLDECLKGAQRVSRPKVTLNSRECCTDSIGSRFPRALCEDMKSFLSMSFCVAKVTRCFDAAVRELYKL